MAIADLTRAMSVDAPSEDALLDEGDLRLEVHDASRLEWCVSIPLADDRPRKYAIRLELEIAANVFARHSPWDQLQSWTRLDGPAEQIAVGARVTIDGLRRATISLAHKLARVADGFVRHCRLAGALSSMAPRDEHGGGRARTPRRDLGGRHGRHHARARADRRVRERAPARDARERGARARRARGVPPSRDLRAGDRRGGDRGRRGAREGARASPEHGIRR